MRRSQSTLLTTLAVVISLLFMSQFPTISPVSNIHPDDTDQERPPTTDSDGDGIPDALETYVLKQLYECLDPNNSDSDRISLSFNTKFIEK